MKKTALPNEPKVFPLFSNKLASILFLPLRLWVGMEWITASSHKLTNPGWMVTGEALKGFWVKAVAVNASGSGAITYDWYRHFLQTMLDANAYVWFGKFVACGEMMVGIALILGAFTGLAAFFGALMNWNFMMAGTASTNPMLFVIEIFLMLGWRVAGYIGADYFLLGWVEKFTKKFRR